MKRFTKYVDAENYAKEVSARELKPVSIVHLFSGKRTGSWVDSLGNVKHTYGEKEFTVMDTPNEWFYGIEHVMLVRNFESPFEVHSFSPKSGNHVQAFPTKELADKKVIELKGGGWKNVYRLDLTNEQYLDKWVNPFKRSNEISSKYRKTLLLV